MAINEKLSGLLSTLLTMHEQGRTPDRAFIEEHVDVFEQLWERGLGCIHITRMASGRFKHRSAYSGVLTPAGIAAAKAIQQ